MMGNWLDKVIKVELLTLFQKKPPKIVSDFRWLFFNYLLLCLDKFHIIVDYPQIHITAYREGNLNNIVGIYGIYNYLNIYSVPEDAKKRFEELGMIRLEQPCQVEISGKQF